MEENKHTQLDAFVKKQIKKIPRETPSFDFTSQVMKAIEQQETVTIPPYKPLISKPMWFVIASLVAAIIIIPLRKMESSWFDKISLDVSFLDQISITGFFEGLSVPTTAFYGLVLFTLMIFAQVLYVKGFFRPKISVL
jgi:hypothetical protein